MAKAESPSTGIFGINLPVSASRTSYFFELLDQYTKDRGFGYFQLREHQEEAIREGVDITLGKGVGYVAPTGKGKTLGGFSIIYSALIRGQIGVYLVPRGHHK